MTRNAILFAIAWVAMVPAVTHAAAPAEDAAGGDVFTRVMAQVEAKLAAASAARKPPLKPPTPVRVKWRARRVSSVDLGAPLLDLAAADLDGDNKAELVALTTSEVVVLQRRRPRKVEVLTRIALSGTPASIQSRLPVGSVSVGDIDGDGVLEVYARSSRFEEGSAFRWKDGKLVSAGVVQGFPMCPGASAAPVPGRHVFTAAASKWPTGFPALKMPESFFAARCRSGMVDATGRALGAVAVLDTKGHVAVHTWLACAGEGTDCRPGAPTTRDVWYVGTAYTVADVNQDGRPELISASNRARGDADRVSVYAAKGKRMRRVFMRAFSGGVVGVAAGDIDGDGDVDAVAAVRLLGSARIDLWVLN